jgi:mannose-6-phosphate isomerase-like protein (cupin superfamily)
MEQRHTRKTLVVRSNEGRRYRQGPSLFKAAGEETGGRFDFFEMTIEYLTGPGLHYHFVQDDTFYVLEGVLAVQFGDEVVELGPGDFCTVPPGVPHTFDNIRKDQPPVKVINLMTPAGYEGVFAANESLDENADPAVRDQINADHEVTYVGPPLKVKLGLD